MALSERAALRKDVQDGIGRLEHRHFTTIAAAIRATGLRPHERRFMAEQLARGLEGSNPRFDAQRFVAACLYDGGAI